MRLKDIVEQMDLEVLSESNLEVDVKWAYTSDLLSDVMSGAEPAYLWLTIQKHMNIIAVAKLKELAGIVLSKGVKPSDAVVEKARAEGINLFLSNKSLFEIGGELYEILKEKK